jgi:hypothetical protein
MNANTALRLGMRRAIILFLVSLVLVWAVSEGAYLLQKDKSDRAPRQIELVIPKGTAASISAGQPVPSIPEEMVFVVGDTLVVRNNDVSDHQLGPLWVPAGTSASLMMEQANRYAYTCSFQASKFLGLTVKQPTTLRTRLSALGVAVPATTAFLFVYSILIWPLQPRQKASTPVSEPIQENPPRP